MAGMVVYYIGVMENKGIESTREAFKAQRPFTVLTWPRGKFNDVTCTWVHGGHFVAVEASRAAYYAWTFESAVAA
jgi:hypothetical protein